MRELPSHHLTDIAPKTARGIFLNRILMLTGASAVAPLLMLAAQPMLTRLYTPEEYGAFGIFEAALAICVAVSTMSFNLPIPVRNSESEAMQLLLISLIAVTFFSLFLYLPLNIYQPQIGRAFGTDLLTPYFWLLPIAVFCSGCFQAMNSLALRRRHFSGIAQARLAQGFSQAIAQVGLGVLGLNVLGLLAGLVIGRACALITLAGKTGFSYVEGTMSSFHPRALMRTAWGNRKFPILASWSGVISVIGLQVSVLLMAYYYGAEIVGYFSLAFLLIAGPIHIVNSAVIQTFLSEAPTLEKNDQVASASLELFRWQTRISLVPALVCAALAPELFGLLFGSAWTSAGGFAQLLFPALIISFMGAHLPAIVIMQGEQLRELIFSIVLFAARVAALAVGATLGSASLSVGFYALVTIILLLIYDCWLLRIAGNQISDIARMFLSEVLIAALLVAPLWASITIADMDNLWPALILPIAVWTARMLKGFSELSSIPSDTPG